MKAILISEHGGYEQLKLRECPKPILGPGQVLIKVASCGLNHLDLWVRKGVSSHRFPLPMIPGSDVAGIVEDLADDVVHVDIGTRVVVSPGMSCGVCEMCLSGRQNLCPEYSILGESCHGGCAEYVCVPAANAIPLPETVSFNEAAAVPVSFLTAFHMLKTNGNLHPGDTALIHAAGSGTGTAAIQIAKMIGARVITTAGTDDKLEKARELGADVLINYTVDDFLKIVRKETDNRGVDLIFDHVGPEIFDKNIRALARGGRYVTCGSTTGGSANLDMRRLFFRNLKLLGSTMGGLGEMLQIWRFIGQGRLRPIVDKVFTLEEVGLAHEYLESRKAFGKVVVEITDTPETPELIEEEEELPFSVTYF